MPNKSTIESSQRILQEIERAISEIQFGSIQITLHEGRVTQIERCEKVRFAADRQSRPAPDVRAVA